ncbi:uncharacterized protein LOC134789099 [Penaeus indicus]|uniref:uncharacterized protein LOC134789099 n=1 Tax=Penaeus indicus TaxID=29960 RepID=UPI00300C950F
MLDLATAVVLLAVSLTALQTEGKPESRISPVFDMKMGPCRIGCAPPPPPPPPPMLSLPVRPPAPQFLPFPQPPPQFLPVPQPPPQFLPVPQLPPREGPIPTSGQYQPQPTRPEAYNPYPRCDNSGECRAGVENTNLNKVDVSPVIS